MKTKEEITHYMDARAIVIKEVQQLQVNVWARTETHEKLTTRFGTYSKYLNLPAVLCSVIFSSGTFFNESDSQTVQLLLGSLGAMTTLLVTLSTHFDFSGLSDSHKHTSFALRRFDRRLESFYMRLTVKKYLTNNCEKPIEDLLEQWQAIGTEYNSILENAPNLNTPFTTINGFMSFSKKQLLEKNKDINKNYMEKKINNIDYNIIPSIRQVPIKDEPLTHCTISQYSKTSSSVQTDDVCLDVEQ